MRADAVSAHMTALEGALAAHAVAVEQGFVERGCSPKAGSIATSPKANSQEATSAGQNTERATECRQLHFGPQALDSSPENDGVLKEAALKDLETLFSNLMPGRHQARGPQLAGGSDTVVPEGMSGCCSCSRRVLQIES